jgi:hypothetical protein
MPAICSVASPYEVFFDAGGAPLENGRIFIGAQGQNPETAPIAVYWDVDLTQPASQPIRTLNGVPSRNGSPGTVYVAESDYSLTVRDRALRLVYTTPFQLTRLSAAMVGYLPAGYGAVATTVQNQLRLIQGAITNVMNAPYYASPLASASFNRSAIQSAIDAVSAAGGGAVLLPKLFDIDASLLNKAGVTIVGLGRSTGIVATGDFKVFNQNTGLGAALNMEWHNFLIKGPATSYILAKEGFHAINLFESENVVISDMWFEDIWGDGIYVRTNKVRIENVHCKNTYRQGVSVTDGDEISIKGVRGEGTMITLVDIEPNAGDQINHLTLSDVKMYDASIPALRFYHSVVTYDIINDVTLSDIETTTLGVVAVSRMTGSNVIIHSSNSASSLDAYLCKNVTLANVIIDGAALTVQSKFKMSSCSDVTINGINIEGGSNIDVDLLSNTDCTVNGLVVTNTGNIGVRLRNSAGTVFNDPDINDASTYAFYLVPTTANAGTRIHGIKGSGNAIGVYLDGANGNTYIDGDLSGATTKVTVGGGYSGQIHYGDLIGVSPLIGSKSYTITAGLADGAGETTTVTVTGVVLGGGFVDVHFSRDTQGIVITGWISSANTVSVRFQNESGGPLTIAAGVLTVYVRRTY